jgi:hypothetical protein
VAGIEGCCGPLQESELLSKVRCKIRRCAHPPILAD